jgi:hypothetical protein
MRQASREGGALDASWRRLGRLVEDLPTKSRLISGVSRLDRSSFPVGTTYASNERGGVPARRGHPNPAILVRRAANLDVQATERLFAALLGLLVSCLSTLVE